MACLSVSVKTRSCFALACFGLLSFAAVGCLDANAAIICVQAGDTAGLQTALATAAGNGEDDLIELQAGQYAMGTSFLLDYEALTEHHDVTIEGGYGPNFGDPCGLAPASADPTVTVLDGGLLRLKMNGGATGTIAIKALTVMGTVGTDQNHAPVEIFGGADASSNIAIDNMMVLGNVSTNNAAVYVFANQGTLKIHDSLFASNSSFAGVSPVHLGRLQANGSACAEIINTTFTNNMSSTIGVDIVTQCPTIVANDIFWGNPGGDVFFEYASSSILGNDDFGNLAEAANTQSSNLLSVDPLFNADYSLRDLSPLRNLGDPGGFLFALGQYDVVGNPRIYGARPDIGAFEIQDVIFAHGFDFQPPF
jgi:hypothetical protein